MTCVYICLYKTTFVSPQMDEFIIKVHKWTGSSHWDALKLLSS